MSLHAFITTAIDTECEPEMACKTLDDVRSEVDDRVAAVTELIITKILHSVLCESHTSTMDVDEVTISAHLDAARRRLLDTTIYSLYIQEFTFSNEQVAHYAPSANELELATFDRFITVADEIRAFVPRSVDLSDSIEFDEEMDFEAYLQEQEQQLRKKKQ